MSQLRTKTLLKKCIIEILKEDMGGDYGGLGLDSMAGMPYGVHYASQDQLYKIFIKPFADVIGVAAGKTKELSQKGQTLLKVAFEAIATSLIPILEDSYSEIFAKEKKEIEKIRSEYADVYEATWDAFKEADVLIAAFMFRPDLFLTAAFVRKSPKSAAKMLSVLSGGTLDNRIMGVTRGGSRNTSDDRSEGPGMPFESVVREGDDQKKPDDKISRLEKLITDKETRQTLMNSPKVRQMSKVGQSLVQNTLNNVYKQAHAILASNSLQDLQSKLGKKLPGLDKLKQVPQNERHGMEQKLLDGIKKSMKEFYSKQLEEQAKSAIAAGVPSDHPYIKAYVNVISKIKNT